MSNKTDISPNLSPVFSPGVLALVDKIIARYPEGKQKSALLPLLHMAQAEFGGYLSSETMAYVASLLHIQPIEVYEVASFYSMFNLEPVGSCVIEVCQTGPCCLNGAEELIAYFEHKLGIRVGETTPDGLFTLRAVECLAACGEAPVVKTGFDYHSRVTPEMADEIIKHHAVPGVTTHQNPYRV